MKIRFLVTVCASCSLILSACQTATPIPSTSAATLVPPTETPIPTNTPEPSPTPIILPDILKQTFSEVGIEYSDTFEYVLDNVLPKGWSTDEKYAGWITKDSQFKLAPKGGTVFYFSQESITPNKGVSFSFKYTGTQESFTLGFDAIKNNGERIPFGEETFYSVAMELRNKTPYAYGNKKLSSSNGVFDGNMNLLEDVWYDIALGYDKDDNYIIRIQQSDDPSKQLTYSDIWKDFPEKYYFISWVSSKRILLIDNFNIFSFESILQN